MGLIPNAGTLINFNVSVTNFLNVLLKEKKNYLVTYKIYKAGSASGCQVMQLEVHEEVQDLLPGSLKISYSAFVSWKCENFIIFQDKHLQSTF